MPTTGEFFAYGIALLTLVLNFTGRTRDSKNDSEARGRWQGGVDKQLEQVLATSQATAKKVEELASIPAQFESMNKRIDSLEKKIDRHISDERGDFQ